VPTNRAGVSVAGVDISGLTDVQAQAKIEQQLVPILRQDVVLNVAGHRYRLAMPKVGLALLGQKTAQRARRTAEATPPAADGTPTPVTIAPIVTFKAKAVDAFVAKAAKRLAVAPKDASISIGLTKITRRHSKTGRALDVKAVTAAIEKTLVDPALPRTIAPGRLTVQPKVLVKDLGKRYPRILTVDRAHFKLRLFTNLRLSKTYGVAVGQPAYPTPTGLYAISNKQVNPTWTVPNSPWAGELAGQSVNGNDPTNPLKARWMGIVNGVGIHGTGEDWSIGSRASHGCIRMHVPDVIDLYNRVPVGTPVLIR
jgi:lipoprotein-anchoring transpeptidase ErfK/SrfK